MKHHHALIRSLIALATAVALGGCSELGIYDLTESQARDADFAVGSLEADAGDEQITLSWNDPADDRFSAVQIEYSPGAGVLTVDPGTQSITIGSLTNGTSYQFDLYAIADSGPVGPAVTVMATPSLPSFPDDEWHSAASVSRRRLVIDGREYDEVFEGFPLMVQLDSARIAYTEAAADGSDLRFFDAGNTSELFYEIESWDPSGESIVWVRVPALAAGSRDYIWMYWGGGATTSFADASEVWSEYELVLHLSDDLTDSSPNARNGSAVGSPVYAEGPAGTAIRVGDEAIASAYVNVPGYASDFDHTTLGAYTVELWMLGDDVPATDTTNGPLMGQSFFSMGWDNTNTLYTGTYHFRHTTENWTPVAASPLAAETWYYAAAVFDGTAGTATSYRDGGVDNQLTEYPGTVGDRASYLRIGEDGGIGDIFDGMVDEVRITHQTRSAAWIAAQYRSMTDALVIFGEVEQQ
ncbi:MAG: DUF2341 domain-containing protein [Spirochaetota bacterium]